MVFGKLSEHRRTIFRVGLALGMGLFIYQVIKGYQFFNQLVGSPDQITIFLITLAFVTLAFVLPTITWGILMRSTGSTLPWIEILRGYPLSFIPRYIPGSIWGYLGRSEWLFEQAGMPYAKSLLISFLEIWIVLVSGITVILVHILPIVRMATLFTQLIIAAIFILTSWVLIRIFTQIPFIRTRVLRMLNIDSLPEPSFGYYLLATVLYGIMWFLYGVVLSGVLAMTGLQDFAYITGTTAYFAISWMAGFLAIIIPSGLGVRELALASLLSNFPKLSAAQVGASVVFMRFLVILGELFWLGISQAIVHLYNRLTRSSSERTRTARTPFDSD